MSRLATVVFALLVALTFGLSAWAVQTWDTARCRDDFSCDTFGGGDW